MRDDDDLDVDPDELLYSLEIVQQPLRARMCGFGNKDRRNITPAPVLKLIARLPDGRIVPASHLGKQSFVVTADLWLEDEVTDRNLVLVSSIPSSRTAAYTQQQNAAQTQESQQDHLDIQQQLTARVAGAREGGDGTGVGAAGRLATTATAAQMSITTLSEATQRGSSAVVDSSGPSTPTSISSTLSSSPPKSMPRAIRTPSKVSRTRGNKPYTHQTEDDKEMEASHNDDKEADIDEEERHGDTEMEDDAAAYHSDDARYVDSDIYELKELERKANETGRRELSTRNLVGQIAVCGQVAPGLNEDMTHIWFAFSILSIRTEGFFKIRFCLSDLQRIPEGGRSTTICEVFSNTIHVQTPKRFEGTCDNNDIAIHLNRNSIKIPARKDEKKLNKTRKTA
ncbi:hypothetical protein BG015_010206 [Linnemannia schmuckeri]|uniref:Velvet domain-containing protein n=1 Tax=Linnemannia schmuckeri TaxID=64567 RepID=A0A9P5V915_9FUNG|nr:hypothetical protein BG015_010206 [Linnemannia schmuckeri]